MVHTAHDAIAKWPMHHLGDQLEHSVGLVAAVPEAGAMSLWQPTGVAYDAPYGVGKMFADVLDPLESLRTVRMAAVL